MTNKYLIDDVTAGNVKISDDVIATIASVAAENVEGVVKMQSNLKSSVTEMLGSKNLTRGVKVNVGEKEALVDMYITVEYGNRIIDICKQVQSKVKEAIENMTDLDVVEVNIHVSGISVPEEDKVKA
ncbi:MAG: Asp23/Gls24 family envelope stress response protein [Tissierellia bacterium]|nr:Asp23/Gls24 family envelope stress response protein [Tissierellia bacterium]